MGRKPGTLTRSRLWPAVQKSRIAVPPAPAGPVLAQGRRLRRRRQLAVGASLAAGLAVVVGGASFVVGQDRATDDVAFSVDALDDDGRRSETANPSAHPVQHVAVGNDLRLA